MQTSSLFTEKERQAYPRERRPWKPLREHDPAQALREPGSERTLAHLAIRYSVFFMNIE